MHVRDPCCRDYVFTMRCALDAGDDEGSSQFAVRVVDSLIKILSSDIDLRNMDPKTLTPSPPSIGSPTPDEMKIALVRDLWLTTRTTIPRELLRQAGEQFFGRLNKYDQDDHKWREFDYDAQIQWAQLFAEILLVCDVEDLKTFWATPRDEEWYNKDLRRMVWRRFVRKWMGGTWEGAIVLLSVPF